LTELEYSGVGRNKENSARMLGHLVLHAPKLIKPYMEPILKVSSSDILGRDSIWLSLQVVNLFS